MKNPPQVTCTRCGKPYSSFSHDCKPVQAPCSATIELPARILAMCKARGWSLNWPERGAYLHLEASELIESLRGKRGDPTSEAADVLLVLMSITEANGIAWPDVLAQAERTVARLETAPRYAGEQYTPNAKAQGAPTQGGDSTQD